MKPVYKSAALLVVLALAVGCTHLSVKHLNRRQWVLDTRQTLEMKYWRFEYTATGKKDHFLLAGTAYPLDTYIPDWAMWIDDLWMAAYLSDAQGMVLARDLRVFNPQNLDYGKGVPFEFRLKPEHLAGSGDLYVTFGYRMRLIPHRLASSSDARPLTGENTVFFANENALKR